MAPLDVNGDTLGEKHRQYNKSLNEAIGSHEPVSEMNLDGNDVDNLLKIDLASHMKNVDYILNVLKCGDMLYVSRALKQCTWLVADQQYSYIINPEYLHTQLLPHMNTKAFIKLIKHVRHNIKDEVRAEEFYIYEKKLKEAVKWLPYCSKSFIEKNIEKHVDHLKLKTFKRLCEKSLNVVEIVWKHINYYEKNKYAQSVNFLLNTDVDKFLDILEKDNERGRCFPKFNDKATDLIMKNSPRRVIDKFDQYVNSIDIPTFTKYLEPDEIKSFLYSQAVKDRHCRYLFSYDSLKYFIKKLPKSEQFQFVKKIFIDDKVADIEEETLTPDTEAYNMNQLYKAVRTPRYVWYQFANFSQAFEDITVLISKDSDNEETYSLLKILISCTKSNLQHIQTLLQYYLDKHKNAKYRHKLQFTTELLKQTHIHKYDEKTWNMLNEIFNALQLYEKTNNTSLNNDYRCIEAIIIYNILHDQEIPAVIKKRFTFKTLKSYGNKLDLEQKEKVFLFLYEFLINELNKPVLNENDLSESIKTMKNVLELLKDWQRDLKDYPFVIDKIKEFVKHKRENTWKVSLSSLYNFNKSWRRYLFEESVVLYPSEEVCLNALKHEPQLLERYKKEVETLRTTDTVSLRRLLNKLRIYWPESLAQHWTEAYLLNLNRIDGHKATVRGLCTSLSQKELLKILESYKPAHAKINWNEVDDRVLNIQRFLAKNMHIARPQPSPDSILLFAKGDYLQFALPSLIAIFYNLSLNQSHQHIPKLLDAPVSIQKHGIRFAFRKLDHETIKKIFLNCWKSSKNVSIRAIIFTFTFELLCNEKEPTNAMGLWELLELFIDNLTFVEDKKIYDLLANVEKIPLNVRGPYLVKSYKFLNSLIPKVKEDDRPHYDVLRTQLAEHCRIIMDILCPDFVTAIIQEFLDSDFFGSESKFGYFHTSSGMVAVTSAYLLFAKNANIQIEKYKKVFVPIMNRAFIMWGEKRDGNYVMRSRFQCFLSRLCMDLKEYVTEKNMIIPVRFFSNILTELEKSLSISENYLMITKWRLTVAVTKLAEKAYVDGKKWDNDKNGICYEIAKDFGNICLKYLKEDVKLHFLCMYKLFSKALDTILSTLFSDEAKLVICECLLSDEDFVQGYLTTIEISSEFYKRNKSEYKELWAKLLSHPSVEVKMHYYNRFEDEAEYILLR